MKRLTTFLLIALLSLGVASVSMAQTGSDMGGEPGASATPHHGKAKKQKKPRKTSKRARKHATPGAEEEPK
jgi:hypothetical protein